MLERRDRPLGDRRQVGRAGAFVGGRAPRPPRRRPRRAPPGGASARARPAARPPRPGRGRRCPRREPRARRAARGRRRRRSSARRACGVRPAARARRGARRACPRPRTRRGRSRWWPGRARRRCSNWPLIAISDSVDGRDVLAGGAAAPGVGAGAAVGEDPARERRHPPRRPGASSASGAEHLVVDVVELGLDVRLAAGGADRVRPRRARRAAGRSRSSGSSSPRPSRR